MDDPLVEQRLREGNRRFGGGVEAGGMRGAARGTAQVEQQKQRTLDGASRLPDHQVVIFGGQLPVDLTQRVPFTVFPDLVDLADIFTRAGGIIFLALLKGEVQKAGQQPQREGVGQHRCDGSSFCRDREGDQPEKIGRPHPSG